MQRAAQNANRSLVIFSPTVWALIVRLWKKINKIDYTYHVHSSFGHKLTSSINNILKIEVSCRQPLGIPIFKPWKTSKILGKRPPPTVTRRLTTGLHGACVLYVCMCVFVTLFLIKITCCIIRWNMKLYCSLDVCNAMHAVCFICLLLLYTLFYLFI